jgi:hypothetical protein
VDKQFGSVSRRSEKQIQALANSVRRELGVGTADRLAMLPVLEFAIGEMIDGAYMAVEFDGAMQGAEARTDWHQPVITLSASTHSELSRGDNRARMTAAHELGHLLMHTQAPIYYYRTKARDRRFDPEWQATYFASALLMPPQAFRKIGAVSHAMKAFGVSRAAVLRWARELNVRMVDDLVRRPAPRKKGHGTNRTP